MARLARIVIPDIPHHVTQRGNRRQTVFLTDDDYAIYRDLLIERCTVHSVQVWSYCLMPNHVHLILVPPQADALARTVGETHRRYSAYLNARLRVTGHVFQGRFGSIAMDERHFLAAARYIALNPVTAGLAASPAQWRWSSAAAHVHGIDDALVSTRALLERVESIRAFFEVDDDPEATAAVRQAPAIGRPLMEIGVQKRLERELGRVILPKKRGPKVKTEVSRDPG